MKHILAFFLTGSVMAVTFYFDASGERFVPHGIFIISVGMGFGYVAMVVLPVYLLCRVVLYLLKWPAWSMIAIAGAVYLAAWLCLCLFLPPGITGIKSVSDVLRAGATLWVSSLPYLLCDILLRNVSPHGSSVSWWSKRVTARHSTDEDPEVR